MWAGSAWAEAPWASPVVPASITVGTIPPPVPGDGVQPFTWAAPSPVRPWAAGGWAGGIAAAQYLGGGIQANPDPINGVVNVSAWWPNIQSLELMRLTPDGATTPVRGGFPIKNGPTRFNFCNNPSGQVANNGYFPRTGTPTFSTALRADTNGPCILVHVVSTGEVSFDVPFDSSMTSAPTITVGFDLLLPRRPGTGTVKLSFLDSLGVATTPASIVIDGNTLNESINQWSRVVVQLIPPPSAADVVTVNLDFTSMVSGDLIGLSEVTIEDQATDGSPADGSIIGGLWNGTPGLSTTTFADVMTVIDGECPLDVPVVYQLWNTSITGGEVQSVQVTLDSNDQSWISHSSTPDMPVPVTLTITPDIKMALQQTTLQIIGRSRPVVIVAGVRQAPSGSVTLDSPSFAYRTQILELMQDGSALFFRAPGEYGYGYGQWLSLGDWAETAAGRAAWQQTRAITLPFQEVDPPVNTNLNV